MCEGRMIALNAGVTVKVASNPPATWVSIGMMM
jgi:hypothetical protein